MNYNDRCLQTSNKRDIYRGSHKRERYYNLNCFNDASFKDLTNLARDKGYNTSLTVLFLDTIQQSIDRISFRSLEQSGITISNGNARINFNENFKNVCSYFFYFDRADFYIPD